MQGHMVGTGLKVAVVSTRWNDFMGGKLTEGAQDTLIRHGVAEKDIDHVIVPGCFEIPLVAKRLAESGKYQAVVCLGVLIRGSTIHFDLIAAEAAKGLTSASLSSGVPVTFGIITTETIEQAIERCGCKAGNKGAEAASAAIEMANLMKELP
ncbi:6,7-dimethyl-8-ribityllumazine synthase [Acanthopleuribacter pedis]|uniref:6,7-dimethyl-8-ribityllumazine synthase n=2 Tax=Acanthopleuribacter pedis TaxID=442870 RepID=A0A8J7Q3C7_9BACT|nr:6,7-dimethyl-8-ribityllumazine synthase [Acanthopleuribacter pedis]